MSWIEVFSNCILIRPGFEIQIHQILEWTLWERTQPNAANDLCMSVLQYYQSVLQRFFFFCPQWSRLSLIRMMDGAELWLHRARQFPGSPDTDGVGEGVGGNDGGVGLPVPRLDHNAAKCNNTKQGGSLSKDGLGLFSENIWLHVKFKEQGLSYFEKSCKMWRKCEGYKIEKCQCFISVFTSEQAIAEKLLSTPEGFKCQIKRC